MHLAYTAEQEALARELRRYYATLLDPDTRRMLRDDATGTTMRSVVKQMAADGWLGVGWPTEWGGQGRGPIEQFIFFDESTRTGAPVPVIGINTVGPALMAHGTEEQKRRFLPGIVAGETFFCIGYSEPEAGTDLGSLRTTAVRDGDEYVITGQKMWTSYISVGDYCWLAARTDPTAEKHKGISILIVPLDSPGITVSPLRLLNDHDIAAVYYDEVRVPVANLVGGENNGWRVITSQLNHERVTIGGPGLCGGLFADVRRWAAETRRPDGRRVIDDEWVRTHLARCYAGLDVLRLMNWRIAWDATQGRTSVEHVSATKVFGSELYLDVISRLMEVVGERAYLKHDADGAVLAARLEEAYRYHLILTFGGGANEVQRELIAGFGLGLPRAR
ncbi:MAG TPA: acyl-CoA dehydrogenase family protein [Acidimicrobiia bacterium]|nr:acyl-CoA dehydrogenase family protein [Acidimicrobiia bacterium]